MNKDTTIRMLKFVTTLVECIHAPEQWALELETSRNSECILLVYSQDHDRMIKVIISHDLTIRGAYSETMEGDLIDECKSSLFTTVATWISEKIKTLVEINK